jgi:hypothetical protein
MVDTYWTLPKQVLYIAMLLGVYSGNAMAIDSTDAEKQGRHRYFQSCVICHGEDAKGTGMMAKMLKVKSADLTTLSRNNGGKFPFERIYEKIDGRDMPRHVACGKCRYGERNGRKRLNVHPPMHSSVDVSLRS